MRTKASLDRGSLKPKVESLFTIRTRRVLTVGRRPFRTIGVWERLHLPSSYSVMGVITSLREYVSAARK
jgi:hypothetical protein